MPLSLRYFGLVFAIVSSTALMFAQDSATIKTVSEIDGLPTRIAFGSCGHQNKSQPVLETVVGNRADIFIYLGDNIYGDTRDMDVLKAKYEKLGDKPEFRALRENAFVLSIWDDHDYGENDAGKEYPMKAESREIFFDFWAVPDESPRRDHPGIYGSHRFNENGKSLQIILLDTRSFRDPLKQNSQFPKTEHTKNQYQPDNNPSKTLLGEEQWQWLEEQLSVPADLRIICTSIQFSHEYNGWESWNNLPVERRRMLDTILRTRANGVVFVSGDVHWGEISVRQPFGFYPIHDVTASGLTETWPKIEDNKYRHGDVVPDNHYGQIEVDWQPADPVVKLQIIDVAGNVRTEKVLSLSELKFNGP